MGELPGALYEPQADDEVLPTELTRGPWDPRHQHAGPPSALLARAVERAAGIEGGAVARFGVDILRPVPADEPLRTRAAVLRPGRRVEQVEAVLETAADGTELMRATAWRMRSEAVELPDLPVGDEAAPPDPDGLPEIARPNWWRDETGYVDALEWRFIHGTFEGPGPAACWTRLRVPLVAGEATSPLEHLLVMGDAASGISATLDWRRWLFINVNFDAHLQRLPEGEWLAMDAVTRPGPAGAGLCTGVLHDTSGRVGVSTQSLLIAPR